MQPTSEPEAPLDASPPRARARTSIPTSRASAAEGPSFADAPATVNGEAADDGAVPAGGLLGAFTRAELRAMGPLCATYALRLLGLYMVLPVLSVYARSLPGSTPFLTGMSIGIYGFTNMLLVLPFGMLSDAIGRKRVIVVGLGTFALGSLVAGLATSITGLLVGRGLQGLGAVSSAVVALVGDVTRPQVRARAMALLGMSVAAAFAIGVIGGPSLAGEFGVRFLFLLTAALSVIALVLVAAVVPRPSRLTHDEEHEPRAAEVRHVLLQPELLKLDAGMFVIHLSVTAIFVVIPILLDAFLPAYHLWRVYAPIIVLGMTIMLPTMIYAEKMRRVHVVLYAGIVLFGLAFLVLWLFADTLPGIVTGLALFVVAFGLLEPTLTTLLTRFTTRTSRGTAAGVFNMSGFFGAFVGGAVGGLLLENHEDLFLVLAATSFAWLVVALRMSGLRETTRASAAGS